MQACEPREACLHKVVRRIDQHLAGQRCIGDQDDMLAAELEAHNALHTQHAATLIQAHLLRMLRQP